MLVAVALITSSFIYENQRDDETEYLNVIDHARTNRRAMQIMTRSSEHLIRSTEAAVEKSPSQKPLVEIMKEIDKTIYNFYQSIGQIQSEIFQQDEEKIRTIRKYVMPIGYNSTAPVRAYFEDGNKFDQLEKRWQETIKKLKKLCRKDIRKMSSKPELLSESELKNYYEQQGLVLKNNTTLLTQMIEKKELHQIKQYDVVHADALLTALKSELTALKWVLLKNVSQVLKQEKSKFKPIIMMSMEKAPIVGEATNFEFFLSSYGVVDSMKIRLNGKPYEVKDGMATFNYTPKSAGMKYFKVDISLKNPFTGKTDNFSRTEKIEVFE